MCLVNYWHCALSKSSFSKYEGLSCFENGSWSCFAKNANKFEMLLLVIFSIIPKLPLFLFWNPKFTKISIKKKKYRDSSSTAAGFFFNSIINPLLLQASSSTVQFFFCSCSFFSHFFFFFFFLCNIFLSILSFGWRRRTVFWVRKKNWRRDKIVCGGKEKIFDGNGGRNGWMRKSEGKKNKNKGSEWDTWIWCKEIY